jgi:hypothetical protein
LPVLHAIEVAQHALEINRMLIARVWIVPAENSNGFCNIGLSSGHHVHKASDYQLVYGQIADFFVGLSLVKLHFHSCRTWYGLIHSEHHQDCLNVAVLTDVDPVMLRIGTNIAPKIEGTTTEIMHPEPLVYLILICPLKLSFEMIRSSLTYRMTAVMTVL